ncbi:hypothetical protein [Frondihabitans sp. PAMC 28766]|uniref:hypothetical protein n=1 Tax=Frondihabitans sp. PAMC 28766 TaxID=1795630 RepID=UPI0012FF9468|nr:hypothetical protein [Frondihabitans sp. PAMC 28766]
MNHGEALVGHGGRGADGLGDVLRGRHSLHDGVGAQVLVVGERRDGGGEGRGVHLACGVLRNEVAGRQHHRRLRVRVGAGHGRAGVHRQAAAGLVAHRGMDGGRGARETQGGAEHGGVEGRGSCRAVHGEGGAGGDRRDGDA